MTVAKHHVCVKSFDPLPWHGWLMVGLLVLASLTSKAIGAAWALFTLMGLWQVRLSLQQNKVEPLDKETIQ